MDPFAQLRIWKCGGLRPLELFQRTRREFRNRQLSARCAQFAYYSMLALMPLLIVIVVAIRYMPVEGVLGSFLNLLERIFPPEAYQVFRNQILNVQQEGSTTYIVLSLLIFFYAGSRLFL
ncbi:MAG: YhjD/YihY/BrkB family envelope integrity protein, partial [Pirellulales bacterium]|nr:YhjD/YihY/BrkB family envelope integrity protein [Pirellulales bacterium]